MIVGAGKIEKGERDNFKKEEMATDHSPRRRKRELSSLHLEWFEHKARRRIQSRNGAKPSKLVDKLITTLFSHVFASILCPTRTLEVLRWFNLVYESQDNSRIPCFFHILRSQSCKNVPWDTSSASGKPLPQALGDWQANGHPTLPRGNTASRWAVSPPVASDVVFSGRVFLDRWGAEQGWDLSQALPLIPTPM